MSDADVDAIAGQLLAAYRGRTPIPPLTRTYPGLTVDEAYAIQQRQADTWTGAGGRIIGYKIGLTSAAIQQQLGVDRPDYGHLMAGMVHGADQPIAAGSFLQPRAEPEVALVLGWQITLADTIADNASSAGLVLGATPTPVAGLDLALLGCVLRRNGRIEQTGAGAAVMGSPLHAATWLANTLTARGARLTAGHVILTGSLTAAVPVSPGDAVSVAIDRLGTVTAVFD